MDVFAFSLNATNFMKKVEQNSSTVLVERTIWFHNHSGGLRNQNGSTIIVED